LRSFVAQLVCGLLVRLRLFVASLENLSRSKQ
jgi:hypothetical protein